MYINNIDVTKNSSILKNGKPTIALLLGSLSSSYFEGIIQGASITAKEKGFNIITFSGGPFASPYPEAEARDKLFELLDKKLIDGIIVTLSSLSRYITKEETNTFIESLDGVPMVNISGIYDGVINIQADFEIGFDQLFDHYVNKHGYKRMAFFRGPKNHGTSENRMAIYKKMLEKYGLEYDESLVVYGDLRSDSAIEFVEEFFDRRKGECDAIISINDRSIIEIMNILKSRGISVPEDIAISGSMGVIEGLFTQPQLTTIYEPIFDIGAKAIETIADILSGKEVQDKINVPTELIIRQSCGCGKMDLTRKMANLLRFKGNDQLPAAESIYQSLEKYFLDELTTHLNLTSVTEIRGLLQVYKKAITKGYYKQFLETLREHLMMNLRGDDMTIWFAITSGFLYSTIQLLTTKEYTDDLVHFTEALVVLCQEIQQGTLNYKKYEANYYLNFIQDIGSNLNSAFDLNTIKDYVINILETKNCYISKYMEDDKGNRISKNILAVYEKVQLDLKEDDQEFLATRLIPEAVTLDDEIYNLIIFPLIARHEFIGYTKGAANYPAYILNGDKTAYADSWNHSSVTVLCHMSHWAGYRWHQGTDRYKDTKGEIEKILYKYFYNTLVSYPVMRSGTVLETNIYRWKSSFNILRNLEHWGDPKSFGKTKLNEKWNAHTIEIEFKNDSDNKSRAVKKDAEKYYITNSECVLIYSSDDKKYIVITKNANSITYGDFKEPK